MVIIKNYGIESEIVRDLSESYTIPLAKIFGVKEEEVIFTTERGYSIHNGIDQTDYFSYVEIVFSDDIRFDLTDCNKVLKEIYNKFVMHTVIRFVSFHHHDEFININEEYPQYMTAENILQIEHEHEHEEEEEEEYVEQDIYEGDIFADFKEE